MRRVRDAANAWGSDYFRPKIDANKDFDEAMEENRKWIQQVMAEGRIIWDIGQDKKRPKRSPFYDMEKKLTERYPLRLPKYWPSYGEF